MEAKRAASLLRGVYGTTDQPERKRRRETRNSISDSFSLSASTTPSEFFSRPVHSDIWRCVIQFVPLRPRLSVISLVCRQWRDIARSAPVAYSEFHRTFKPPVLPNITSLDGLPTFDADFANVRHLSYRGVWPTVEHHPLRAHLTALSSLVISGNLASARQFVFANVNTLTRLEIVVQHYYSSRDLSFTTDDGEPIHLPSLKSLSMRPSRIGWLNSALPLLARHCSQLTALAWHDEISINDVRLLAFPHLQYASYCVTELHLPIVPAPSVSVSLRIAGYELPSLAAIALSLVRLEIHPSFAEGYILAKVLAKLPHLTALTTTELNDNLPQLRELNVHTLPSWSNTSLSSLVLRKPVGIAASNPLIRSIREQFPNLRCVTIGFFPVNFASNHDGFVAEVKAFTRQGLGHLTVQAAFPAGKLTRQLMHHCPWLEVRFTTEDAQGLLPSIITY